MIGLIIKLVTLAIRLAYYAVWVYVILSWIGRSYPKLWNLYCILAKYIEPLLNPIQKLLMPVTYKIGIDFSPYVLAVLVNAIGKIIIELLSIFL